MGAKWKREDIPYDAMGDYSAFVFDSEKEDPECEDQDRNEQNREDA